MIFRLLKIYLAKPRGAQCDRHHVFAQLHEANDRSLVHCTFFIGGVRAFILMFAGR